MKNRNKTIFPVLFILSFIIAINAKADIQKSDILSSDQFVKMECAEWIEEVSATTTPEGATTTEQVCKTYEFNDYVRVLYKGEKSDYESNEIANERKSKVQTFDLGNGKIKKRIYARDQFIKSGNSWYDLEVINTMPLSDFNDIMGRTSFIEGTAAAETATTTVGDGYITNKWGAWSTIRDAASGSSVDYTGTSIAVIAKHDTGQGGYRIDAGYLPFDEIPQGGDIESASIFLYITAITTGDDDPDAFIVIASSTVSDKTQLTTADYNKRKFVALSEQVAMLDIADDEYNEWELNATGISHLSTTTFFSVLEGHDYNDNPIQDDKTNQINFSSSEAGGSTHDPYIEIIYISTTTPTVVSGIRIDEWFCSATTSGNNVQTRCQAPILIWVVGMAAFISFIIIITKWK